MSDVTIANPHVTAGALTKTIVSVSTGELRNSSSVEGSKFTASGTSVGEKKVKNAQASSSTDQARDSAGKDLDESTDEAAAKPKKSKKSKSKFKSKEPKLESAKSKVDEDDIAAKVSTLQIATRKVENLKSHDPLRDLEEQDKDKEGGSKSQKQSQVHIRIAQRNGRKTLTTIEGVPAKFDLRKIVKKFKKDYHCGGTIVQDEWNNKIIQLNGDQRDKVEEFLMDKVDGLEMEADQIKKHGF